MQFKKEDEALGVITTSLIEKREGTHPSDEQFALYLEGKLNTAEKKVMVSHFVSCRECRERLAIPARPLEAAKEAKTGNGFLSFLWRPLVAAPAAALLFVLLALGLNTYFGPQNIQGEKYEERYRGANLVALKQVELTPGLLKSIKEKDQESLKNELIKHLPPGVEISHIFVQDELKYLEGIEEGKKANLILYSNGLLKVKLE